MRGRLRVTILGSGTLLPDREHGSAGHLVEDGDTRILLDCGSGVLHALHRHGREWEALTHLALSHYHTDHFGDLPALLWALTHGVPGGRTTPLTLLGPPGLHRVLDGLRQAHGDFIRDPGFPLEVVEVERDGERRWDDLRIRTHPTPHSEESVAYRLDMSGGSVGYTGDTGPSDGLGLFFAGVDLLISECALADPTEATHHLSPRSVGALATTARPGMLILTHLYPELSRSLLPDLLRAEGYTGRVLAPGDGAVFRVGGGSLAAD